MTDSPTTIREVEGRRAPAAGTWTIDATHTTVEFVARHLMVSKVRGAFRTFTGSFTVGDDPADSKLEVSVDMASVESGTADRDNHLRSADFFDIEQFPTMTFVSTSVEPAGSDWKVTGDLTIRDVTRPLTLDVEFLGVMADPWGNAKAVFSARGEIDREDFGLTWNVPLETGGFLVSKTVHIEIEAQAAFGG
jgi:polyisoprenoid-binding protein YceI